MGMLPTAYNCQVHVWQQFTTGDIPLRVGEPRLLINSWKFATRTRVVLCKVPSPRARIADGAVTLKEGFLAAERRWELALWILNPAIAVQIRARSYAHRHRSMNCAVLFGRLAGSCWVWSCSRFVVLAPVGALGFRSVCIAVRKAGSTRGYSRAVPRPSTNRALRRLTSEVGNDPVHSTVWPPAGSNGYGIRAFCGDCFCSRTLVCMQSWQHPEVFPGGPPPQY